MFTKKMFFASLAMIMIASNCWGMRPALRLVSKASRIRPLAMHQLTRNFSTLKVENNYSTQKLDEKRIHAEEHNKEQKKQTPKEHNVPVELDDEQIKKLKDILDESLTELKNMNTFMADHNEKLRKLQMKVFPSTNASNNKIDNPTDKITIGMLLGILFVTGPFVIGGGRAVLECWVDIFSHLNKGLYDTFMHPHDHPYTILLVATITAALGRRLISKTRAVEILKKALYGSGSTSTKISDKNAKQSFETIYPNLPESMRNEIFHYTVCSDNIEAVQILLPILKPNSDILNKALFYALENKKTDVANLLIKAGAKIHALNEDDHTTPDGFTDLELMKQQNAARWVHRELLGKKSLGSAQKST